LIPTMRRIAVASPNRAMNGCPARLAPSMMAMTAAASSVRTIGFANCSRRRASELLPLGFGSSFGPSRASRRSASTAESPRAGSVARRARSESAGSL
jgi:hypothetical protein